MAKSSTVLYVDGGTTYLELHALRSPVGRYLPEVDSDTYDFRIREAIQVFEEENNVEVFELGRSGRHICIEDTPTNRRRYASLSRKAIEAAKDVWTGMREKGAR